MATPEPDLRFLQANERTLLAWVRTGLGLMAFGFAISRLAVWLRVEHAEHDSIAAWIGIALLVSGVLCQVLGSMRFVKTRRALIEGRTSEPSAHGPVSIAVLVGLIGIVAVVYLALTA